MYWWAQDYAIEQELAMSEKSWIKSATDKMKKNGTIGSFGEATPKKIAKAKKEGGKMAQKANFASSMKAIARKRA